MPATARFKRYLVALTLSLLLATGVGIVAGFVIKLGQEFIPSQAWIVLVPILAVFGILACLPWWRSLDEMQRETQLTSWFWGGSFGILAGIFVAYVIGRTHQFLVLGALVVVAAQVVSYGICWVALRFIRRRAA